MSARKSLVDIDSHPGSGPESQEQVAVSLLLVVVKNSHTLITSVWRRAASSAPLFADSDRTQAHPDISRLRRSGAPAFGSPIGSVVKKDPELAAGLSPAVPRPQPFEGSRQRLVLERSSTVPVLQQIADHPHRSKARTNCMSSGRASSSRRPQPPKRVVELHRPTGARLPHRDSRPSGRNSSGRLLVGTLQLLAGLVLIVVNAKTDVFGGSDLALLTGVLLAGGSMWWFGVFDRPTT